MSSVLNFTAVIAFEVTMNTDQRDNVKWSFCPIQRHNKPTKIYSGQISKRNIICAIHVLPHPVIHGWHNPDLTDNILVA